MKTNHFVGAPLLALVLGTLTACGGSTSSGGTGGSASVSGTVAGTTFTVASQLAFLDVASANTSCTSSPDGGQTCTTTSSGQVVGIILTNRADATCAFAQSEAASNGRQQFASFDLLTLEVGSETGNVAPGTYAITTTPGAATGAGGSFTTNTSTCGQGLDVQATSGTVTLTQVGASIVGTYDVTFGTQGKFTGSFDVAVCATPDAGNTVVVADAGPPVCVP